MSYILDALNKSEQERERKQTPGLKSLQGEPAPSRFQLRHFLYLLALLVIFNSIGVFIYFGNDAPPEIGNTTKNIGPSADSPSAANADMVVMPEASSNSAAAQPTDFTPSVTTGYTGTVNELPDHISRRLPEVLITAHIYASDPDLRMVNINGVSRSEGDLVSDSFQLVEITEVGVVMNFEGYAYVIDIVEDWKNNP